MEHPGATPRRPAGRARRCALAPLLAAAVLGLAGCGDDVDPEPSGAAPVTVTPSLPSVASGVTQVGVPQLVNITLDAGTVTGVAATVPLRLNTPVRLTALTDTAEVLLVEGYDVRTQLTVGEPVQVAFIADRAGTYDVVLEDSGTVLTTLDVG